MRAAVPLRAGGMFSEAAPCLSEILAGYPWPYCNGQSGFISSYTNSLTARRMAQQATGKGWFPKTIFGGAFRREKWSATLDPFAPGCPASRLPASVRPACSMTLCPVFTCSNPVWSCHSTVNHFCMFDFAHLACSQF